jgi:urease accessory protein
MLAALQLGSSGLPIGRFAQSYGMERAIRADPSVAPQPIVANFLTDRFAPLDGAAIVRVLCGQDPLELDARLARLRLDTRWKHASQICGTALARLSPALGADSNDPYLAAVRQGEAHGELAVVHGVIARSLGLSPDQAVCIELVNTARAMLLALVRLGTVAAIEAQSLLASLRPQIEHAAGVSLSAETPTYHGPLPGGELCWTSAVPQLFQS